MLCSFSQQPGRHLHRAICEDAGGTQAALYRTRPSGDLQPGFNKSSHGVGVKAIGSHSSSMCGQQAASCYRTIGDSRLAIEDIGRLGQSCGTGICRLA
jgi:hypothetical protein